MQSSDSFGRRNGFTTGTCAAAAAKAALLLLNGGAPPATVEVPLPDGSRATLPLLFVRPQGDGCAAAVRKDAGDDPDMTDGVTVVARVCWRPAVNASFASDDDADISFAAGDGVGVVTLPGLALPPGEPAINPGPRAQIRAALREVSGRAVHVCLAIPGGEAIAAKTFNPRLGVTGGLSILGTTGRVRPFSAPALREALRCSVSVAAACGVRAPVLVPGHIGERAARRHFQLAPAQVIEVSNLWGDLLDEVARRDFTRLLLVGHPGKLAKLAAGHWNTHSSCAPAATALVRQMATPLAQEFSTTPLRDSVTVEDVFTQLEQMERLERQSDTARHTLAGQLADAIRLSVRQRLRERYDSAVALVNLRGELLGSAGDLRPWR